MKEYSNAFLSNYHYSKFIEIFNSGTVYYDTMELEFIKKLRNKYDLNVVFTSFYVNKLHTVLYIYIDFDKSNNEFINELCYVIRKNEVIGQPLNYNMKFDKKITDFANALMDEYLDTFYYDKEKLTNFNVYIYDFRRCFLSRIHNVALADFKSLLKEKFVDSFFGVNVFIDYEPSIKIVVDNFLLYKKLLSRKKSLTKDLFSLMKKYDMFNLLDMKDVNLIILSKDNLSGEDKNRYYHLSLNP